MAKERPNLVGRKMAVEMIFNMVRIEFSCGSDYEAQVFFDDIVDRLRAGEGISLQVQSSSVPEKT